MSAYRRWTCLPGKGQRVPQDPLEPLHFLNDDPCVLYFRGILRKMFLQALREPR